MNIYSKEVLATDMNSVSYSIYRNSEKVFTESIEPVNIGFMKTIILGLFFGMPRIQQALFDKAHKKADRHIDVMSKNDTILK